MIELRFPGIPRGTPMSRPARFQAENLDLDLTDLAKVNLVSYLMTTTYTQRSRESQGFPQFFPQLWKTLGPDQTAMSRSGIDFAL
jgi:hypothetical protein